MLYAPPISILLDLITPTLLCKEYNIIMKFSEILCTSSPLGAIIFLSTLDDLSYYKIISYHIILQNDSEVASVPVQKLA
jgi:hypothetical protein